MSDEKKQVRNSDLEKIVGHKNYLKSKKSGKIYYKDAYMKKFSTGETTIQRAKKVVEERKRIAGGLSAAEAKRKVERVTNPAIADVWAEIVKEKATVLESGTIRTYTTSWKLLEDFFGQKHVAELNEKTLTDFKNWYIRKHSGRLVVLTVRHLKVLIRYCFENSYIRVMPKTKVLDELEEKVDIKSGRKSHKRVYTPQEVSKLVECSKSVSKLHDYLNVRSYLAVLLGVRCGFRKHEVLRLKWSNIDYKGGWIEVFGKNKKWRKFPLTEEVKAALQEQEKITRPLGDLVFPMPSNPKRPISSQVLDKAWNEIKDAAKIRGKSTFHDLRRTCVTRLLESGVSSDQISKMLDHTVKEMHDTYYMVTDKFKEEVLKKIEKQGEVTMNKSST